MRLMLLLLMMPLLSHAEGGLDQLVKNYFRVINGEKGADLEKCFITREECSQFYGAKNGVRSPTESGQEDFLNEMKDDVKLFRKTTNPEQRDDFKVFLTEFYALNRDNDGKLEVLLSEDFEKAQFVDSLLVTYHWKDEGGSIRQTAMITSPVYRGKEGWKFVGKMQRAKVWNYSFIFRLAYDAKKKAK